MNTPPSMEARALVAAEVLAVCFDETIASLHDEAPAPQRRPLPTVSALVADAKYALALGEVTSATLIAEAAVRVAVRKPRAVLRKELDTHRVTLRGEARAMPWEAILWATACEPAAPRRDALVAAADAWLGQHRSAMCAVVDAICDVLDALGSELTGLLALGGDPSSKVVLDATEELFHELDARVRHTLELPASSLTWSDWLRTLASPHALREIPPATWTSLASRPFAHMRLGAQLRPVRNMLAATSSEATGVRVVADARRTACVGAAPRVGLGASDTVGALFEAAFAMRSGGARIVDAVTHVLGRRLLLERSFLAREAGLDAAARARVLVELLHGEVARMRLDAALSEFAECVTLRGPDAESVFHDQLTRAVGASPSSAWAPAMFATLLDGGGFWRVRSGAWSRGACLEAVLTTTLRARFDEDWFRNPRAGVSLVGFIDDVGRNEPDRWTNLSISELESALTARLDDLFREATRVAR